MLGKKQEAGINRSEGWIGFNYTQHWYLEQYFDNRSSELFQRKTPILIQLSWRPGWISGTEEVITTSWNEVKKKLLFAD